MAGKKEEAPVETDLQHALRMMMAEVGYVQKDARNEGTGGGYKYASADAVLTKVRESAAKHGVAIIQTSADMVDLRERPTKSGGLSTLATVKVRQVYQKGAERAIFEGMGSGSDSGDKAIMKANTAALKYLLSLAFNISWGDDPEAHPAGEEQGSGTAPAVKNVGGKAKVTFEGLAQSIAQAASLADLDALKPLALGLKASDPDGFEKLKSMVSERRASLQA